MTSFNSLCSNTLPDGTYKVQITDITFKRSNTNEDSNNLVVHYMITEGPLAKKTLIDTIFEKTFSWRLKPFLEACGIDTAREFATTKELFNYGISNAKGKIIMIEVGTRMYNGTKYNDVKNFAALPGSTTSASEVADLMGKFNFNDTEIKDVKETPQLSNTEVKDVISEPKIDFNLDDEGEEIY